MEPVGHGADPGGALAIDIEGAAVTDLNPFMGASLDPVHRSSSASFEEPDAASSVTVEQSVRSIVGQAILDRESLEPSI
jgi:hypothetical protein